MGPLHDPVTWYKIIYTGEQVAQWDLQNNATRTSSPGPAFVLEVPLRNLLTSIYNFVPCDWVVQRAHLTFFKFEPKTPNTSQHVATRRNRVAKLAQHAASNNVVVGCVDMLRSFGRGLKLLPINVWVNKKLIAIRIVNVA